MWLDLGVPEANSGWSFTENNYRHEIKVVMDERVETPTWDAAAAAAAVDLEIDRVTGSNILFFSSYPFRSMAIDFYRRKRFQLALTIFSAEWIPDSSSFFPLQLTSLGYIVPLKKEQGMIAWKKFELASILLQLWLSAGRTTHVILF